MAKMYAAVGTHPNLDMFIAGLQEIRHEVGSVAIEDLKFTKPVRRDEYVIEFTFVPDVVREMAQNAPRPSVVMESVDAAGVRTMIAPLWADRVDLEDLTEYRHARTITDETGAEFIRLLPGTFDRILAELRSHRDLESGVHAAISAIEKAL